jgi:hypothetical protein
MKIHSTHTTNTTTSGRRFPALAAVRDELRERRQARAAYRALEHDLASYNTRSDVDDLLAALSDDQSLEAAQIRSILARNMARQVDTITRHPLAS